MIKHVFKITSSQWTEYFLRQRKKINHHNRKIRCFFNGLFSLKKDECPWRIGLGFFSWFNCIRYALFFECYIKNTWNILVYKYNYYTTASSSGITGSRSSAELCSLRCPYQHSDQYYNHRKCWWDNTEQLERFRNGSKVVKQAVTYF